MSVLDNLETRRKEHDELLERCSSQYKDLVNDSCEFTFDGPSNNWLQYSQQHPRIMFLLKEAHGEWWQPSVGGLDITSKKRFSQNVRLWKYAIDSFYQNPTGKMHFPNIEQIPIGAHDVAFVEVKKLNQGKSTSNHNEIEAYAKKDKEFLKRQIELIDPHVVLCAATIDFYDIIHDEQYDPYVELSSGGNCKCWQLSSRLVIDFRHPSCSIAREELYSLLCRLMIMSGNVFETFSWSKWFDPELGQEQR